MLIDQAKIYVSGGDGGDGCQSLYKDIFNRRGVPDGGDGGSGGDVIIEASRNLHTLLDYRYNQHHKATRGKHGSSNNKIGKRGSDCLLKVPVGTVIVDASNNMIIRDLAKEDDRVVVARGGLGGKGNSSGREASRGVPGEEKTLLLELKLVADAGIIGFPNAGKSTLVSRISKSHTKIAPYPFTTRSPKLGVVKFHEDAFVVADMPGLIEGAHDGKGLGDRFLRHIERTVVLVHLVDMAPLDGSDPVDNYLKLEKELELYGEKVCEKPRVIVASKMDMTESDETLKRFIKKVGRNVWPISAKRGDGIKELVEQIYREVQNVREKQEEDNC